MPPAGGVADQRGQEGSESKLPPSAGTASGDPQGVPKGTWEEAGGVKGAADERQMTDGALPANVPSAVERGRSKEREVESALADAGGGFLDRRPPYIAEEAWRVLSRAQQDELHEE